MDLKGRPLVVSYGLGVDSTAALVGMVQRGIRPDLILFADVGAEKQETYDYLGIIGPYLDANGFPPVTVVRYVPKKFKHWPPYYTLEENCLTNGTLPSISFGFSSCSQKWKQAPQHAYIKAWAPAIQIWANGQKVVKAIGYDCSSRDQKRSAKAERLVCTYKDSFAEFYDYWYPLQEWGWDRVVCKEQITAAGLAVPAKSSCFFCIAMKPEEVDALPVEKLRRIVLLEARAKPRLDTVEGLWRSSRKKAGLPGSMTQYIVNKGLLPQEEVERIQRVPDVLVQFQKDFMSGLTTNTFGQFLHQEFPEMYTKVPQVPGVKVIEMPQPTLFDALEEAA